MAPVYRLPEVLKTTGHKKRWTQKGAGMKLPLPLADGSELIITHSLSHVKRMLLNA